MVVTVAYREDVMVLWLTWYSKFIHHSSSVPYLLTIMCTAQLTNQRRGWLYLSLSILQWFKCFIIYYTWDLETHRATSSWHDYIPTNLWRQMSCDWIRNNTELCWPSIISKNDYKPWCVCRNELWFNIFDD